MAKGDFSIELNKAQYNSLKRKLEALEDIDKTAAVSKGLKEGMKPIVSQGKRNLAVRNRKRKGNLNRSFSTSLRSKSNFIKAGFRRPGGAAAHLVDRGTKKRWTKKGAYRGSVSKGAPNHGSLFWTNAVLTKGAEAVGILMDAVNAEIIKILNRN